MSKKDEPKRKGQSKAAKAKQAVAAVKEDVGSPLKPLFAESTQARFWLFESRGALRELQDSAQSQVVERLERRQNGYPEQPTPLCLPLLHPRRSGNASSAAAAAVAAPGSRKRPREEEGEERGEGAIVS